QYNRVLLQRHNAAGTPVRVVHAGIDTAAYRFRPRGIPPEGEVRTLTVASLQQYKGHEVLLEALAMGGSAVDRITLDLIGDGVLR
ncbi:colanic acid biosynthesis glycosyltransferase WcaL, partial [Mycobacterium sp. ITM-2017-0098]